MAKSKRKRIKSESSGQVKKPATGFSRKYIVYAVLAALLGWAGYDYFAGQGRSSEFAMLAEQGKSALSRVEVRQSEGRGHVSGGQRISYGTNPPTSGPHFQTWVNAGFYESAKSRSNLVHSLEHGNVVLYYDAPGDAAMATLRQWTRMFTGPWSGMISVRRAGLGEKIVITAWRRTLRLNSIDEPAAAAFIDAYRGRGPEQQVR